ncbi:putative sugar nucleotidyl transferase [Alienimonas californiensis]|uniref:UDP-3-O-[3-hydroxymyristoyl] glucosamine N-acyltransferase n=1 Tax=Alienimonas californiensis TaxID=2527989 RepID=A0A517PBP9_9PLAN|nr:putative sugar nucleotidyl transferase [Alienimonas californiensis]QDT16805.1 UDP-3-O-[3-hydroxymyristoyl] glucosamine N-acyltransferase [Alienimonas californiensis]
MSAPVTLFEDPRWLRLLPLVYLRSVGELLCGAQTLRERTERRVADAGLPAECGLWVRPHLAELTRERTDRPVNEPLAAGSLLLSARGWWRRLPELERPAPWVGTVGSAIACIRADAELAAALSPKTMLNEVRIEALLAGVPREDVSEDVTLMAYPWDLVAHNDALLRADWEDGSPGAGVRGTVHPGSHLLGEDIHIGAGSVVKPCVVIDATEGPVWIGENCTIQPHSFIEGPCYLGDRTLLQPGAVVHEGCTVGRVCKIGGELEASIFHPYSNKQHDGFLGHAVVGSFVNVAADVVASDLKNTYGRIRVPLNGRDVDSGRMFVGPTIGDHSKVGINVSFPTGAVMGFCSSVVGPAAPKFTPSFAWLDSTGGELTVDRYDAARGLAIAKTVMARRQLVMSPAEEAAFLDVRTRALASEHASQVRIESGG